MAKIRIYQFAKLLKISNDEALKLLRDDGHEIKSNLSSIDEDLVKKYQGRAEAGPSAPKARSAKKPAAKATKAATASPKAKKPRVIKDKPSKPAAKGPVVRAPVVRPPVVKAPPAKAPAAKAPSVTKTPAAKSTKATAKTVVRPSTSPSKPSRIEPRAAGTPRAVPKAPSRPAPAKIPPKPGPILVAKPGVAAVESPPPSAGPPRDILLTEGVTVKELSEKLDRKSKDIIKRLMEKGVLATINQPLDVEVAKELASDFGCIAEIISFEEDAVREHQSETGQANRRPRDPVVTIMGHVDHGKTSLLDAMRESNITSGEHGGITQHIGAYQVEVKGRKITFIDTPGHEAFTLMRSRGARVTDIVVLVVAADDGVMPQTVEAIDHAKAAGVPLIVAINKIDKPDANLDRVKKGLADHDLLVEDWGGDVVSVAISAKQKLHIGDLLDMILLVADLNEFKADADALASGTILEARLDKARGPLATILVQDGTLSVGDAFIAGSVSGKVRAMFNDCGDKIDSAGPSVPVEVLGVQGVPNAGDRFQVIVEEWKARQIGTFRQSQLRRKTLAKSSRLTLNHLYQQIKEGAIKELPIILKGDVHGSVEVLAKSLADLGTDQVKVRNIHSATGAITETDVLLASASNAIIVGFNVRPDRAAAELAEKEKVDIRLHTVIYEVHAEIKNAMVGLLDPTFKEAFLGRAEVRNTFKIPKIGLVAGTYVLDGKMLRGAQVRLLRDSVVVHKGRVASLKRFKEDVTEVKAGFECGIGLEKFNDVKVGDVIEAFKVEKILRQTL